MESANERIGEPEIATTTLAEIYVQQGLIERALAIYRRVAERSPGDARVGARVAELEREIEHQRSGAAAEPVTADEPVTAGEPPAQETAAETAARFVEASIEPASVPAGAEEAPALERGKRRAVPAAEDAEFLAWLEGR